MIPWLRNINKYKERNVPRKEGFCLSVRNVIMSVTAIIKQKSLFRKKLNIDDIIKLTNLSYGVSDETYRLTVGETADHTLIYDEKKLARGIDVSFDGTDIVLQLSLPTSSSEIKTFYDTIEKICKELRAKTYIRDGENALLSDNNIFIQCDEEGSVAGLESIQEKIGQNEYERLEIFGVYNPISIGQAEIKRINNSLYNFEEFLHGLQSLDVYYAAPKVYKIQDKLVGIYMVGPNIPSVIPTKPYIVLNQIEGIEEWYVMLKEGKTVSYEDFINNVKAREYYDANHVIVTLSDGESDSLAEKYFCKL